MLIKHINTVWPDADPTIFKWRKVKHWIILLYLLHFSVPKAGLEPARAQCPRDFKSLVSTIPPFRQPDTILFRIAGAKVRFIYEIRCMFWKNMCCGMKKKRMGGFLLYEAQHSDAQLGALLLTVVEEGVGVEHYLVVDGWGVEEVQAPVLPHGDA